MYLTWREGAAALEAAAGLCSILNAVYFLHRSLDPGEMPGRRIAAGVLALVSLGTLVESVVVVSVLAAGETQIGPLGLTSARAVAIAGAVAMAALVLRRLAAR